MSGTALDCRAETERRGGVVAEECVDDELSAYSAKKRPAYAQNREPRGAAARGSGRLLRGAAGVALWAPVQKEERGYAGHSWPS